MARGMTRAHEGIYRAVGIYTKPDGKTSTYVQGPYLTASAARGGATRIHRDSDWALSSWGGHVETWIEKVADPTWVPVAEEIKL